jgi:hypothetical protein
MSQGGPQELLAPLLGLAHREGRHRSRQPPVQLGDHHHLAAVVGAAAAEGVLDHADAALRAAAEQGEAAG